MRELRLLVFVAAVLASVACGAAQRLNVFIWSEYLDREVVTEFERRFDCKLAIDLFEDAESMLAKMQAGGDALYDIVVPPDYLVPAMIKLGLLAPLRHAKLPNLRNLDSRFLGPPFDPRNEYSVAYQWGTVGIFYRKQAGVPVPDSWAIFFDPAHQPGPFVLIDSARDLIGAALKYRGTSLNSTEPAQLKGARDVLIAAKKRCLAFEGSVGGKNRVLGKSAVAAIVYSGEAARGMNEDPGTGYVIPKEGSQIWLDNLVIPVRAPHRDIAEKFIDFLLDPRIGARISNYTQFATPNQAARAFIKPGDLDNPAIYPPPEVMVKLEFLQDLRGSTRLYDQIWTQVKAK